MTTNTNAQRRNQILRKIQRVPSGKLKELEIFVSKLAKSNNKKEKILSYAGAWENMDENLFNELTDNIVDRRQQTKRRINE